MPLPLSNDEKTTLRFYNKICLLFFRVSNKGENFLKIIIISVMKSFDKSLNLGDFTPDTYVVFFIGVRSRYQKFLIVLTHFSKNGLGDK